MNKNLTKFQRFIVYILLGILILGVLTLGVSFIALIKIMIGWMM